MRRVWLFGKAGALPRRSSFRDSSDGAVAVEVGLLTGVFVLLVGGGLEAGLAFHAKTKAFQAARHGARLAATTSPVATDLLSMTGFGSGAIAGDSLPPYDITCSGKTRSCTQGSFDAAAMEALLWGPNASSCRRTGPRNARGMCTFGVENLDNVTVRYQSSGLGRVGTPADPLPIITVSVTDQTHNWIFLEGLLGNTSTLAPVSATTMSESLGGTL